MAAIAAVACRDYDPGSPHPLASGGSGSSTVGDNVAGSAGAMGGAGTPPGDPAIVPASAGIGLGGSDDSGYGGVPDRGGDNAGGDEPTAGEGLSFGAGGAPMSSEPFCRTGSQGHPVIGLTASADISLAHTYSGAPFVVFASQPASEIVALSWSIGSNWVSWACFDAVPTPQRVASGNGGDGMLQVYATTAGGRLFARQEAAGGYLAWQPLQLPIGVTRASDVAAVDTPPSTLYLAAGANGVFARPRPSDESQVGDPAWQLPLTIHAVRVAAGVLVDGRHDVLVVGPKGELNESIRFDSGNGYTFSAPTPIDAGLKFLDVDFGHDALGRLQAFGVVQGGSVVSRVLVDGAWSSWMPLGKAPHLTTIAVGTLSGQPPYLFGIGDYSLPYYSTDAGTTWNPRL